MDDCSVLMSAMIMSCCAGEEGDVGVGEALVEEMVGETILVVVVGVRWESSGLPVCDSEKRGWASEEEEGVIMGRVVVGVEGFWELTGRTSGTEVGG